MRYVLALAVMLLASPAFAAPAVSVSLNPATGVAPYTSTLTWTVAGAASCTASDGWTGAKAITGGTQPVSVTAPTKYTLTCVAADGQTVTTWTEPATNTDNTPYTNSAGYSVYRGTTATNLARVKSVGPGITTYTDTGLTPGNYFYSVTSVNANSAESAQGKSTPYPITVTGSSSTASATAAVQSIPNAPGGVTTTTVSVNVNVNVTTGP